MELETNRSPHVEIRELKGVLVAGPLFSGKPDQTLIEVTRRIDRIIDAGIAVEHLRGQRVFMPDLAYFVAQHARARYSIELSHDTYQRALPLIDKGVCNAVYVVDGGIEDAALTRLMEYAAESEVEIFTCLEKVPFASQYFARMVLEETNLSPVKIEGLSALTRNLRKAGSHKVGDRA